MSLTAAELAELKQKRIEAAARAIHQFELEHGYVTREWGAEEDEYIYRDMARAAIDAADRATNAELQHDYFGGLVADST